MASALDTDAVKEQLEDLQESLEDLRDSLTPLGLDTQDASLDAYMEERKLDPIAQAKMLVTMAYSIDSLLFCHLKMTGTNTTTHTIMNELDRIRQYVKKIKEASAHQKRNMTLDKSAATRMIGHDLANNAAQDRERAIKTARENQRIQERLGNAAAVSVGKHTRFGNSGISQDAVERIVPGQQGDSGILRVETDADEEMEENGDETGEKTAAESMFEETKSEKKSRERRERKAARKDRQRKMKRKKAAKEDTEEAS